MVIKTDLCNFTEYRIYPGRGQRYIERNGKSWLFLNSKAANLHQQRIKPVRLRWTQAWRRINKKGKVEEVHRRKARRAAKTQRGIVGLSLEELKRKRAARPAVQRTPAQDAALKEAKAKKAKAVEKGTKKGAAVGAGGTQAAKVMQKSAPKVGGKR